MAKTKPNLASLIGSAGGSTRRVGPAAAAPATAEDSPPPPERAPRPAAKPLTYREGTRAITVHFPPEVRSQLKILAVQQDTDLHGIIAEAFNDLFAKYQKPEIAPGKAKR